MNDVHQLTLISKILNDYNLTAVEICDGNLKYRVEKNSSDRVVTDNCLVSNKKNKILKQVLSPMVGVFFGSMSPESKPFVKEGQKVNTGDVLCVIESMKNFTEVKAEENGIIKKVCMKNGDVIEYGQLLFQYEVS